MFLDKAVLYVIIGCLAWFNLLLKIAVFRFLFSLVFLDAFIYAFQIFSKGLIRVAQSQVS